MKFKIYIIIMVIVPLVFAKAENLKIPHVLSHQNEWRRSYTVHLNTQPSDLSNSVNGNVVDVPKLPFDYYKKIYVKLAQHLANKIDAETYLKQSKLLDDILFNYNQFVFGFTTLQRDDGSLYTHVTIYQPKGWEHLLEPQDPTVDDGNTDPPFSTPTYYDIYSAKYDDRKDEFEHFGLTVQFFEYLGISTP